MSRSAGTRAVGAILCMLLAAALVGGRASTAAAIPGDLDGTFGDCGIAIIRSPQMNSGWNGTSGTPDQVLASPDGRIWVVTVSRYPLERGVISVIRYLPDGRLDPSFGGDGQVRADIPFSPAHRATAALSPAGGIVVATDHYTAGAPYSFMIRFTPDGTFEPYGGPGGTAEVMRGQFSDVKNLVVQADGSVVTLVNGSLMRFAPDGTRDLSFGGDGTLDNIDAFTAQADGKLVMHQYLDEVHGIARYSEDGVLDTAFGSGGIAPFSSPGLDADSLTVDPFGNILGMASGGGFRLFRVTPAGELDETFGADGVVEYDRIQGEQEWPEDRTLMVDPLGRPVVATLAYDPVAPPLPPAVKLLRFAASSDQDPGLDPEFGFGGVIYKEIFPPDWSSFQWQQGSVLTPDGLVTVVGTYLFHTLLRFETDPVEAPAGYTLSAWGSLHPWGSSDHDLPPCVPHGPYWEGWDIARGVTTFSDASGGYVLSGWGSLHPYTPYPEMAYVPPEVDGPYWEGWDIARDVALSPSDDGGLILSGWGSLHPFTLEDGAPPPRVVSGPYWYGWDIARGVAFMPDGRSGYVLDGWGGLHPFVLEGGTAPPRVSGAAYWPGWDIARGVTLLPDGTGGYVVDGWGGVHPFAVGDNLPPATPDIAAYWPGWDIAEGITVFDTPR
jgi:uncharacterized delta-60 repeat protein